jgi:hypothetical protein
MARDKPDFCQSRRRQMMATVSSQCPGTQDALSLAVDWRFARKFDAYAGLMYSQVDDAPASGFLFRNTINPTAELRLRF